MYGDAIVVFDCYDGAPVLMTMRINFELEPRLQAKSTYQMQPNSSEKKYDFLSNGMNKHSLIQLISGRLQENGCHAIQAEGEADFDIVKAAVAMSAYKSTTPVGEDTDLLVVLLYHAAANDYEYIYFRSDKGEQNVYNMAVLKRLLGDDVCSDLLFIHAFSGYDTTSRIFGVGTKSRVQKVIAGDSVLH